MPKKPQNIVVLMLYSYIHFSHILLDRSMIYLDKGKIKLILSMFFDKLGIFFFLTLSQSASKKSVKILNQSPVIQFFTSK